MDDKKSVSAQEREVAELSAKCQLTDEQTAAVRVKLEETAQLVGEGHPLYAIVKTVDGCLQTGMTPALFLMCAALTKQIVESLSTLEKMMGEGTEQTTPTGKEYVC